MIAWKVTNHADSKVISMHLVTREEQTLQSIDKLSMPLASRRHVPVRAPPHSGP